MMADGLLFTESFTSRRVDLYWKEGSRLGMAWAGLDVRDRQGRPGPGTLHHD
jgi:hypothetical protein